MQASLFAEDSYLVSSLLPFDEEPNAFRRVFELQVQHMFLLCPMRLITRRIRGDRPWLLGKEYRHHVVSVCRTLRHKRVRPTGPHFVRLSRGGSQHLWQSTVSGALDQQPCRCRRGMPALPASPFSVSRVAGQDRRGRYSFHGVSTEHR